MSLQGIDDILSTFLVINQLIINFLVSQNMNVPNFGIKLIIAPTEYAAGEQANVSSSTTSCYPWNKPSSGWSMLNVDGHVDGSIGGAGMVLRNDT